MPTARAYAHVTELRRFMTDKEIAAEAGVHREAVYKAGGSPDAVIRGSIERLILGVTPMIPVSPWKNGEVSGTGTIRRIHVLVSRGWTSQQIGRASDLSPVRVRYLGEGRNGAVGIEISDAIARGFEALDSRDPAPADHASKILAQKSITWARRNEWYGAWLPEQLDDPYALPRTGRERLDDYDREIAIEAMKRGDYDRARAIVWHRDDRARVAWELFHHHGLPQEEVGRIGERVEHPEDHAQYLIARWERLRLQGVQGVLVEEREARDQRPTLVIFTGSRAATQARFLVPIWHAIARAVDGRPGPHVLMEGGAKGADAISRKVGMGLFGWRVLSRPADWHSCAPDCPPPETHIVHEHGRLPYCRRAGYRRNQAMVDEALQIAERHNVRLRGVAVYAGKAVGGTRDCARRMRDAGIEVEEVRVRVS